MDQLLNIDIVEDHQMNNDFDINYIIQNITLVTFLTLFPPNIVIPFIRRIRLIPFDRTVTPYCKTCNKNMAVDTYKMKYLYRCSNKYKTHNPLHLTWFKNSDLTFTKTLLVTFCWVSNIPVHVAVKHTQISNSTVIDWHVCA